MLRFRFTKELMEFVSGRRAAVGSRWLQLYLHSSPNPSFDKGGVYTRSFLFISVKTMTIRWRLGWLILCSVGRRCSASIVSTLSPSTSYKYGWLVAKSATHLRCCATRYTAVTSRLLRTLVVFIGCSATLHKSSFAVQPLKCRKCARIWFYIFLNLLL